MRSYPLGIGGAFVVALLDQLSKHWMLERLSMPPFRIDITSFFSFLLAWNKGISFSLFPMDSHMKNMIFSVFVMGVIAYLLYWLRRAESTLVAFGISLIMGGALGNLIDRFLHGAVVDFILFHYNGWYFPIFNVADTAITVGVGLILIDQLFFLSKRQKG